MFSFFVFAIDSSFIIRDDPKKKLGEFDIDVWGLRDYLKWETKGSWFVGNNFIMKIIVHVEF